MEQQCVGSVFTIRAKFASTVHLIFARVYNLIDVFFDDIHNNQNKPIPKQTWAWKGDIIF